MAKSVLHHGFLLASAVYEHTAHNWLNILLDTALVSNTIQLAEKIKYVIRGSNLRPGNLVKEVSCKWFSCSHLLHSFPSMIVLFIHTTTGPMNFFYTHFDGVVTSQR